MSEINGIEERLDDLPGSEAPSRLTASRASGSTQLFGVAKARRARPGLRRGSTPSGHRLAQPGGLCSAGQAPRSGRAPGRRLLLLGVAAGAGWQRGAGARRL